MEKIEEMRSMFCESVDGKEFEDYRELRKTVNRITRDYNMEAEKKGKEMVEYEEKRDALKGILVTVAGKKTTVIEAMELY